MGSGRPRIIVGISGATGAVLGVRLLEALKKLRVDTHLVVSRWGVQTLLHETPYSLEQVQRLATRHYSPQDAGATIASGSFLTKGMAVCPCSVRSLAAIASGNGDNLLHRAADVVLKERRKLVLVVREAPLSNIHLENMLKLSRMARSFFLRCRRSTRGRKRWKILLTTRCCGFWTSSICISRQANGGRVKCRRGKRQRMRSESCEKAENKRAKIEGLSLRNGAFT